jgi:hypothetical protein
MREIKLSLKERRWLDEHGGRSSGDVLADQEGKLYVAMGSGVVGRDVKVYLPGQQNDNE